MAMKELNILYQCSDEYAFMAGVSIFSLLKNGSRDICYNIYVLTKDMSEENREKMYSLAEVSKTVRSRLVIVDATEIDEFFAKSGVMLGEGSYATYYKLMLQSVFDGKDIDKIFYIDADSLVLGNLAELVDFDFRGMPLALSHWEEVGPRFLAKAKMTREMRAYAAGMIYFNLVEWKKHRCEFRIIEHLANKQAFFCDADQGIINSEFQNEIMLLPVAYNVYSLVYSFGRRTQRGVLNSKLSTAEQMRQAYENPQIVHFCGSFLGRPWEEGNADSLRRVWWDYCNHSPWKGMEPIPFKRPMSRFLRFFRWYFLHVPRFLAEFSYVIARRLMFR